MVDSEKTGWHEIETFFFFGHRICQQTQTTSELKSMLKLKADKYSPAFIPH